MAAVLMLVINNTLLDTAQECGIWTEAFRISQKLSSGLTQWLFYAQHRSMCFVAHTVPILKANTPVLNVTRQERGHLGREGLGSELYNRKTIFLLSKHWHVLRKYWLDDEKLHFLLCGTIYSSYALHIEIYCIWSKWQAGNISSEEVQHTHASTICLQNPLSHAKCPLEVQTVPLPVRNQTDFNSSFQSLPPRSPSHIAQHGQLPGLCLPTSTPVPWHHLWVSPSRGTLTLPSSAQRHQQATAVPGTWRSWAKWCWICPWNLSCHARASLSAGTHVSDD